MKIQIKGCETRQNWLKEIGLSDKKIINELTWYRNNIGQIFDVRKVGNRVYFLDDNIAKYANVDKDDTEIVE